MCCILCVIINIFIASITYATYSYNNVPNLQWCVSENLRITTLKVATDAIVTFLFLPPFEKCGMSPKIIPTRHILMSPTFVGASREIRLKLGS